MSSSNAVKEAEQKAAASSSGMLNVRKYEKRAQLSTKGIRPGNYCGW